MVYGSEFRKTTLLSCLSSSCHVVPLKRLGFGLRAAICSRALQKMLMSVLVWFLRPLTYRDLPSSPASKCLSGCRTRLDNCANASRWSGRMGFKGPVRARPSFCTAALGPALSQDWRTLELASEARALFLRTQLIDAQFQAAPGPTAQEDRKERLATLAL